jgi:hypothetical protein
MATRSASWLKVVSRPTTSKPLLRLTSDVGVENGTGNRAALNSVINPLPAQ